MKNEITISLLVIPVLTYSLKKRLIYRLSDMAYGEWIIFEDNKPRYHLNLFDNIYKEINEYIENSDVNIPQLLEQSFRDNNLNLTLGENFHWLISLESRETSEEFRLEKYPRDFLRDSLKL